MKRMIHSLLAAAILVSAMTCTAFAVEEEQPTTTFDPAVGSVEMVGEADDMTYKATYNDATAGQYVILVVKGEGDTFDPATALDEKNILYIDQKAPEAGKVEFTIKPSAVEDSFVVLGGESEPVVLGKINSLGMLGDVDGDGGVFPYDAYLALDFYVNSETLIPTAKEKKAADFDGDGEIMPYDAYLILDYYVNIEA